MTERRAAVIGSGFGGLAAAIRLQAAGFRVTIFEKRDIAGGRAYVYRDEGFTFDAGPTVVTAPETVRELFDVAGRRMEDYVELLPVLPLYRLFWEDGFTFDYTNDLQETLAQIRAISPEDAERYPEFLKYTDEVFNEGFTKLAHVPFPDWASMLRVAPQLMKLKAYRSVYDRVSHYLTDPHFRQAFSFHSLLVGGNPFSASAIYTLIHSLERKWGVYFAKGGTNALVSGLVKLFTDLGGKIRLSAEVEEITTRDGRVTGLELKNGERETFDCVVSNADVYRTYADLLKNEPAVEKKRRRLKKSHYSMSLFLMYLGTKRRWPGLAHHNVIFGARYRELLDDIFTTGNLADDFSLYVHAPSRTDASVAPEGCEALYVLSPVPHLGKYGEDWKVAGPRYADRILDYLDARYLPGIRQEIVTQRIFTPKDFETELGAHLGSAFSLEPRLTQSAYFRVHNRDEQLRGLYFVGAGTHPGAGIPGVISSAKATATIMLEEERALRSLTVTPTTSAALDHCRERIRDGSKSFSLAARFFEPETRDAACFLYGWCRHADDQVDQTMNLRVQEDRLRELEARTREVYDTSVDVTHPVYVALRELVMTYRIPDHYPLELLNGLAMDVRRERYETLSDLTLYCYRVAGTVGLMMSHAMGVSNESALRHATDLGIAMQLTNIARDVFEDAEMGRVYLPLQWLDEAGVPENQVRNPHYRSALVGVVRRLLDAAEGFYRSGNAGLRYLPFRASFAVGAASEVYASIGRLVEQRGVRAWETRAVVSPLGKLKAVLRGFARAVGTIPFRILSPWRRIPLLGVYRHA